MNNMSNSALAAVGRGINAGVQKIKYVNDSARKIAKDIKTYEDADIAYHDGLISSEEYNKALSGLDNKYIDPSIERNKEQEKTSTQVAKYNKDINKMVAQLQQDARKQDATGEVVISGASKKDVERERQQIVNILDDAHYGAGGYELKRTGIEEMIRQNEARLANETNPSQALINSVNIQRELLNRLKQKQE
jgi:hypothetical protein